MIVGCGGCEGKGDIVCVVADTKSETLPIAKRVRAGTMCWQFLRAQNDAGAGNLYGRKTTRALAHAGGCGGTKFPHEDSASAERA